MLFKLLTLTARLELGLERQRLQSIQKHKARLEYSKLRSLNRKRDVDRVARFAAAGLEL